jgi:hypothetical protein
MQKMRYLKSKEKLSFVFVLGVSFGSLDFFGLFKRKACSDVMF